MSPLQFFIDENILINPLTLLIGKRLHFISDNCISNYSIVQIQKNNFDSKAEKKILLELAGLYSNDVEQSLDKLIKLQNCLYDKEGFDLEKRKWRYLLLKNLQKSEKDKKKLLMKIDEIWADFDYLDDMRHIIYYMPPIKKNVSDAQSHEEAISRLIADFNEFMDQEKDILSRKKN